MESLSLLALVDLLIAIGSAGLVVFTIPTLLNKNSQVPRRSTSIPTAIILTYFTPLFYIGGLTFTAATVGSQAVIWWLIAWYRPIKAGLYIESHKAVSHA